MGGLVMEIKYQRSGEMIYDCKKDGVMVIEANEEGIFEFSTTHKRLKTEFPEVIHLFHKKLLENKIKYGQVFLCEYDGYKFAFLINRYTEGLLNQSTEVSFNTTKTLIQNLVNTKPSERFYSEVLSDWSFGLHNFIKSLGDKTMDWVVLRE